MVQAFNLSDIRQLAEDVNYWLEKIDSKLFAFFTNLY